VNPEVQNRVQIVEDASRSGQAHHVIMSGRMAVVDYLI
jgi:hypothetical protein